jgi:hypothetical protein
MATVTGERITRDDLEQKFRGLQGTVEETAQKAYPYLVAAGAIAAVAIAAVGYVLGNRRGKKQRTVVEIRRV